MCRGICYFNALKEILEQFMPIILLAKLLKFSVRVVQPGI